MQLTASRSDEEHNAWLAQTTETALEPDLAIIDPHHHLWQRESTTYLLPELIDDLDTGGHRVIATVYAECHSRYRTDGPVAYRSLGETAFAREVAEAGEAAESPYGPCRVMFGNVDLSLGAAAGEVLDAHLDTSQGRFRGVRVSSGWDASPLIANVHDEAEFLRRADVRAGIAELAARGLSLDCWLFHPQLLEVAEVADAFPDLTIILDHLGTPILGGPNRGKSEAVFSVWRKSMAQVAARPNVVLKVGALPIRMPGSDQPKPTTPPDSETVAAAWRPWVEEAIQLFSPARCMFESNFPVQRVWSSYGVVWNAFKRLAAGASAAERADLFVGTAQRAYRIDLSG